MLEKTLAMLEDVAAGTFLPDDAICYDEAEIERFGPLLARLVYAPSKLRRRLQEFGVTLTRADFYSEIPTVAEIETSVARPSLLQLDTIFRDEDMLAELAALTRYSREFDPPRQQRAPDEFAWEGGPFSYSDAMAYYCMIRRNRPAVILEIGGGWSTLIARTAVARNGFGRIVCIEPYPPDFLRGLPEVEIIQQRVQEVETRLVAELLANGGILFIDSTHTVKHDSDCLHIYLRLLPAVSSNLLVHAHDIYLPDPLSIQMMRDHQIFWNEQYLLYAYMLGNNRTGVLYGSHYLHLHHRARLEDFMCGRFSAGGASLWFEQAGIRGLD